MGKWEKHNDRSLGEIKEMAERNIARFQDAGYSDVSIYFKFTCQFCGERCAFEEPNMLYETGKCSACGNTQPIEKAGFLLVLTP